MIRTTSTYSVLLVLPTLEGSVAIDTSDWCPAPVDMTFQLLLCNHITTTFTLKADHRVKLILMVLIVKDFEQQAEIDSFNEKTYPR